MTRFVATFAVQVSLIRPVIFEEHFHVRKDGLNHNHEFTISVRDQTFSLTGKIEV